MSWLKQIVGYISVIVAWMGRESLSGSSVPERFEQPSAPGLLPSTFVRAQPSVSPTVGATV